MTEHVDTNERRCSVCHYELRGADGFLREGMHLQCAEAEQNTVERIAAWLQHEIPMPGES